MPGALRPVVGQRRIEILHGQPDLQMGDDKRRGHDLEAEHALGRRLLDPCADERAQAPIFQIGRDTAQYLRQIGSGATAWIEYIDVFRRQPIRYVEIVFESALSTRATM